MNTLITAASIAFTNSTITPKRSARRCLFGKREEGDDDFIRRINDEMQEKYKNKWGFDFANGVPLPTTSHSKFIYTELDPATVPGFYKLSIYATKASPSQENDSENKDPDERNLSMETDDSFILPTTDESALSDFFNDSKEEVVLKSAKKLAATPKKRQSRLHDFMATRKHLQRSAKKSDLLSSPTRHTPSRLRKCSAV